ncbi:Uncharacterised protein [Listeria newyorkensis]|nr:Uncharacterised protein [Listeria newyorkensis]
MKILYILIIICALLLIVWMSLSPLFGKIGKFISNRKNKVEDDIKNNEEDWFE